MSKDFIRHILQQVLYFTCAAQMFGQDSPKAGLVLQEQVVKRLFVS